MSTKPWAIALTMNHGVGLLAEDDPRRRALLAQAEQIHEHHVAPLLAELAEAKREEVTLREMLTAVERQTGERTFCLTTSTAKGQRPRIIITGPADREDAMASMVVHYWALLETIAMDLAVKHDHEAIRDALGLAPEATTEQVVDHIGNLRAVSGFGRLEPPGPRVVCHIDGCTSTAIHAPEGHPVPVACWAHAGDWPEVPRG